MYELLLALFLAFSCHAQTNNPDQHHKNGTVVTADDTGDTDSGGDTEHIPPHSPHNQ
jgi:hypothetical protein